VFLSIYKLCLSDSMTYFISW